MAESTSPKKPAEDDPSTGRTGDQVIRLDSEREQRRANVVIGNDELEAPAALAPAALEARPRSRGHSRPLSPLPLLPRPSRSAA